MLVLVSISMLLFKSTKSASNLLYSDPVVRQPSTRYPASYNAPGFPGVKSS